MSYFNIKAKANSKTRPAGNFASFSKDSSPLTQPKIISQGKHSQSCGAQHHFSVDKKHLVYKNFFNEQKVAVRIFQY